MKAISITRSCTAGRHLLATGVAVSIAACIAACGSTPPSSEAPARTVVVEAAPVRASAPVTAPAASPAPVAETAAAPARPGTPVPSPSTAPAPAQASASAANYRIPEGVYRCDETKRVTIKQGSADGRAMVANINGKDLAMSFVPGQSGALRYENRAAGMVWIMSAEKAMLFDQKKGLRLANNCKL